MKWLPYVWLLRPKQWTKNVFVVAPLFFSLRLRHSDAWRESLLALGMFVIASSAVYVFNDLRDIEADRAHSGKRNRPLASGAVPVGGAWLLLVGLTVAGVAIFLASGFGWEFLSTLLAYLAINVAYSLGMKQIPLVETFMVASGFVIRLIAGCVAIDVEPTNWIVLNTGLIALLLVVGKRRSDAVAEPAVHRHHGVLRGYSAGALDMMLSVLGSGTIMTYILFCVSDYAQRHFGTRYLYISSAFVILGVLRYMQLAHDGDGTDDPSALVLRDPLLRYTMLGWLVVLYFLIY